MSNISRFDTKETYSDVVIHNNTIYLSGQVPWKTAGLTLYEQALEVFELIEAQLLKHNSDKTRILSMQVFLKDPSDYAEMNRAYIEWMPYGHAPARNTICGITFPTAEWGIECVVIAAVI